MVSHRMDSAGQVRTEIQQVHFFMTQHLNFLISIHQQAQDAGASLSMLEIRDMGVAKAQADLMTNIPRELQQTINRYRLGLEALEDYMLLL